MTRGQAWIHLAVAQNEGARANRRFLSLVPFPRGPFWYIFLSHSRVSHMHARYSAQFTATGPRASSQRSSCPLLSDHLAHFLRQPLEWSTEKGSKAMPVSTLQGSSRLTGGLAVALLVFLLSFENISDLSIKWCTHWRAMLPIQVGEPQAGFEAYKKTRVFHKRFGGPHTKKSAPRLAPALTWGIRSPGAPRSSWHPGAGRRWRGGASTRSWRIFGSEGNQTGR